MFDCLVLCVVGEGPQRILVCYPVILTRWFKVLQQLLSLLADLEQTAVYSLAR